MVRTYHRKTAMKYMYSQADLMAAIKAVKGGRMSTMAASKKFKVPCSTISDHIRKVRRKVEAGAPTVFTSHEAGEIVATLQALQEIGFGLTKELAGAVICDYLKDHPLWHNPFHTLPGEDWWRLFLARWDSELRVRKPQHLSTSSCCCILA